MPRVFISYRQADSERYARALHEALGRHYGSRNVFIDRHTIPPGHDFPSFIRQSVGESDALIALIGPAWVSIADAAGRQRLSDPFDWVRLEVAAALGMNLPTVPVLVNGAAMPSALDLPDVLQPLVSHSALILDESAWQQNVDYLIATLDDFIRVRPTGARSWPDIQALARQKLDPSYPLNDVARLVPGLQPGETVYTLAKAVFCVDGFMGTGTGWMPDGLLALTDRRLVFIPRDPSWPATQLEYSVILNVTRRVGMHGGVVRVKWIGHEKATELVSIEPRDRIPEIVRILQNAIGQA